MSDKPLPFVVNDRRKFNAEGEPRPDAPRSEPRPAPVAAAPEPTQLAEQTVPVTAGQEQKDQEQEDPNLPSPPTTEQLEQARVAYTATADRLDIAIRSANPGMDHPPPMSFEQLVQSVYMQSILQLGGGTQEGQQPQVDILGARQSIDMLGVLAEKTTGNLAPAEQRLLESALFELQLAFLEITQALARSAQSRAGQGPGGPTGGPAAPGGRPGPSLIR